MKVSIVIPNWNGEEKLRKNLPKVLECKGVEEIIVSDDASIDNSVEIVKNEFPQVKLIVNKVNKGFSGNVNIGVKHSTGDIIFLLNSDASPDKDCLEFILPHFKDPKVFSVGCNTDGSWSWAKFENGFFWHYMSKEPLKDTHETLWVSGGSGVFRKDVWNELEGLDELFNPFYEEDLDLGYRARKRGYINLIEPKAKVEHYKEKGVIAQNFSETHVSKVAQRNQLFFTWKNITDKNLYNQHWAALIKMLIIHPKYWSIFMSAYSHYSEVMKKRKVEIKMEKVSDLEILKQFN